MVSFPCISIGKSCVVDRWHVSFGNWIGGSLISCVMERIPKDVTPCFGVSSLGD